MISVLFRDFCRGEQPFALVCIDCFVFGTITIVMYNYPDNSSN